MKITFVQPRYHNIWEALGIGYIAGYLQRHRKDLILDFFQAYFDTDNTIISSCADSDIVAFSTTSPSFAHGVSLAEQIKRINPKTRIVFGGWHVSATQKLNNSVIDQIVIGEGEEAMLSIANGNSNRIIQGTKLTFDKLAWPDRQLIKNFRTVDLCERTIGTRVASFQSNRGCPMYCTYCAERTITGIVTHKNPIRYRTAQDLCDEIENINKILNIDYFKLVDATFDSSQDHVINFCEEKISRKLTLPWECMIHANFANLDMLKMLKAAGCSQIDIGCESGSPRILKQMRKGITTDKLIQVFNWAKTCGIKRRAFFILGMPEETEEDYQQTEQLIDQIQPDVVGFTLLCPYPGSDFYNSNFENINWSSTDEYSNQFWKTNLLTNEELRTKQKYFINKYKHLLCSRQSAD